MKPYRDRPSYEVNIKPFLNFENISGTIVYRLVNTERNKEMLEDVPHMKFLDLSVVFHCILDDTGTKSLLIHNTHLKLWGVTKDDVFRAAATNTPRLLPPVVKTMDEVIREILMSENPDMFSDTGDSPDMEGCVPMYVLGNTAKVEGAACLLYPKFLNDFADAIDSDFYIIPSSVHEVILLPTADDSESAEIKCMIKEINDTQVKEEERLSYSLYFYGRDKGKVVML